MTLLETVDLMPARAGTFVHPVIVQTLNGRGHFQEMTVCVLCADEAGYFAQRPTAVAAGTVCPGCMAELTPVRRG